jgi:hypothetical protein
VKQSTRALVAAAAVAKAEGRIIAEVFDHAEGAAFPVGHPLERAGDAAEGIILYADSGERVSLKVREDLFSGWDHLTGAYFAGAIQDSQVMFYDGYDRRYYQFSVH